MKIGQEFSHLGIKPGGIHMFRIADAIKIVKICRERRLRIWGIDGFFITENSTQPSMEHSIDLSDIDNSLQCWDVAEEFLNKMINYDLYFEIVSDDY